MGLYERWTATDGNGFVKIPIHAFGAALRELARGGITRANIINQFSLSGSDVTELDAIISTYQGLSAGAKPDYVVKLHDVMILCEAGIYSRSTAASRLGFS